MPGNPAPHQDRSKYKRLIVIKSRSSASFTQLSISFLYTLSGDGQGCHSPATSTLDEGLRYGSQQAIYDEIQKWQEPVKAKFAEIEKGLERIKQLLEVTKLTPEELAEVHLMLDKAQEIYDQVKKDGSWGVHAPRYLLDRVTSGAAYIVRAQAIVDNGGYQTAADKRAAEKKAAK